MKDYSYGLDDLSSQEMRAMMAKGWEHSSHICGSGSHPHSTVSTATTFKKAKKQFDIETIANVGAGEITWWHAHKMPRADHYDLVPRSKEVKEFDCTTDRLPKAYDLILCRYVLNHLSVQMAFNALSLFCESGSRYLLMTHKPEPMKPHGNSQGKYWRQHGLFLPTPIMKERDHEGWDLCLWDLTDIAKKLTMTVLISPDKE